MSVVHAPTTFSLPISTLNLNLARALIDSPPHNRKGCRDTVPLSRANVLEVVPLPHDII